MDVFMTEFISMISEVQGCIQIDKLYTLHTGSFGTLIIALRNHKIFSFFSPGGASAGLPLRVLSTKSGGVRWWEARTHRRAPQSGDWAGYSRCLAFGRSARSIVGLNFWATRVLFTKLLRVPVCGSALLPALLTAVELHAFHDVFDMLGAGFCAGWELRF